MSGAFRVTPFRAADVAALQLQASQLTDLRWHEARDMGETLASAPGVAFTVRDADGRVIFCGGAQERHANYATLWALFAEGKRAGMIFLWRRTRHFVAQLPYRRVDALVEADDARAIVFARAIGLREEHRMAGASPRGGAIAIFSRGER